MAEGLAAVGVAASIIQLVHFSAEAINRLQQFHSVATDAPEALRQISDELPLLQSTLTRVGQAVSTQCIDSVTEKALTTVFNGCQEQIERLNNVLSKIAPKAKDSSWTKSRKAIASLLQDNKVEKITKTLRNYVATLTFYQTCLRTDWRPPSNAKLAAICTWLAVPDPSINYRKALKLRQDHTGLWFIQGSSFDDWKIEASSFLWLHGIPGCGKTILASSIIQDLLQERHSDPGNVVLYYFFDFSDRKQSAEVMVGSLIYQLIQHCLEIPKVLEDLFSSCNSGTRPASSDSLKDVLYQLLQSFPRLHVVLDALDECSNRPELLGIIEDVVALGIEDLHILFLSRHEKDIGDCLEQFVSKQHVVGLESEQVDRDIQAYILRRLDTDKALARWQKDTALSQEIEHTLSEKAQGMFRWAVCQLDTIGKCRNRSQLRQCLKTLPATLDQTYERILTRISGEDAPYAKRILQWLTCSIRPLSLDEIAEVVSIDIKRTPAIDRDEVLEEPRDVLDICASLVTIGPSNDETWGSDRDVVRLAHYSVKEYLLSDRIFLGPASNYGLKEGHSHITLGNGCLEYLFQFGQNDLRSESDINDFKLAEYAAEFWLDHASIAGFWSTNKYEAFDAPSLDEQALRLLLHEKIAYRNWLRLYDPILAVSNFQRNFDHDSPVLFFAVQYELERLIDLLIDAGIDVNMQDPSDGSTALHVALIFGDTKIMRILLESGADYTLCSESRRSVFDEALKFGNEEVVEMLITLYEAPIDVRAMIIAAYYGQEGVIKMLLDNGADVRGVDKHNHTALHAAAGAGQESTVAMLVQRGANVEPLPPGNRSCNPLYMAAAHGHANTVKLLLDLGGRIDQESNERYSTPICAAAAGGHDGVVEKLLQANPTLPLYNHFGDGALSWATFRGNDSTLSLLLELTKTKPDIRDHYGRSLVFWAAAGGQLATMVTLISHHKLDPRVPDKYGRTPAWIAAMKNNTPMLDFLRTVYETNAWDVEDIPQPRELVGKPHGEGVMCELCTWSFAREVPHFHCRLCAFGDWDMCEECREAGGQCMDEGHSLVRRYWKNGVYVEEELTEQGVALPVR